MYTSYVARRRLFSPHTAFEGNPLMLARLQTFSLVGVDAIPVDVEVDVSGGALPATILVGLPDAAVRESTHRVGRAMVNCGFSRPNDRIVINLAPADLPKQAATFDLPISLGILAGSCQFSSNRFRDYAVVGELSLEGSTRPARGALSMAIRAAKENNLKGIVVPTASASEAAVVEKIEVIPVTTLREAVEFFSGKIDITPTAPRIKECFQSSETHTVDFSDVRGQETAKRALSIAAAGGHNVAMLGPPGSGKTMLAKRLPTILPPLRTEESIETSQIYSALGLLEPGQPLLTRRPFRAPHHTISEAGLIGGRSVPMPGEISLAHNGVLFLDELPEFNRRTLEVLRQPLEDRTVTISRARSTTCFPSAFMLIASMNPCPCGYRGDPSRDCQCTVPQVERYMSKISGPLLDRIDMHLEVSAVPFSDLASKQAGTSSAVIRNRVCVAREIQQNRFGKSRTVGHRWNAQMTTREIRQHCHIDKNSMELLRTAVSNLGLSARAHDKVLRVARTIADLDEAGAILAGHIGEAIQYRLLDRKLWT
ncbi:MAG: YifB family Mg chelatase-like AAA ATPase [Pirellulales bacterium]|nr:YifB family Mg chelatase-like AAA ATPase [Pirellulales bacterium]